MASFAPDYNISYDTIEGNFLQGITIKNPRFKGEKLANHIQLKWNPNTLLKHTITINTLQIKDANVTAIEQLTQTFTSDKDSTQDENKNDFDYALRVNHVDISLKPFTYDGIKVSKAMLKTKHLKYKKNNLEIEGLDFAVDSNITKISIRGNFKNRVVSLDDLSLKDVNISAIEQHFLKEKNSTKKEVKKENNHNIWMPKQINIKNVETNILPMIYKNMFIKDAYLKAKHLSIDTTPFVLNNIDNVVFGLESNISNIYLKGKMKKQILSLDDVRLNDVNISAVQSLLVKDDNKTTKHSNPTTQAPKSLPKWVKIKHIETNILATKYGPLEIKKSNLKAKNLIFDVKNLMLKKAKVDLNASTNLSELSYKGSIKNNHLLGEAKLLPKKELYTLYGLPLRKKAIHKIVVDINASKDTIIADIKTKGKKILEGKNRTFNVDVDNLFSHLDYNIHTHVLTIDTKALLTTPYAKKVDFTNHFKKSDTYSYRGELKAKKLKGIEKKLVQPLENLLVRYNGDSKSIHVILSSKQLKGNLDSKDFKTGILHLETLSPVAVNSFVALPEKLKNTKASIQVDMPLDFKNVTSGKGKVNISSNVVNIDADVTYGKEISLQAKVDVPKKSLLKAYDANIKWKALSPLQTNITLKKDTLVVNLKSKELSSHVIYGLKNGRLNGKLNLAGLSTKLEGNVKNKLKIKTQIKSMTSLRKQLKKMYTFEGDLPPLEGKIDLRLDVENMKTATLLLSSSKLIYKADKKTKYTLKDIKVVASMDASNIFLKSYKVTLNNQKYFSSKKATIALGDTITVSNFWINDSLKLTGNYVLNTQKGAFVAKADRFHIKDKMIDIYTKLDVNIGIDKAYTSVQGKVTLLEGNIIPTLNTKSSFATDSDIIILQRMSKSKKSPFMKNLSLALQVESKKPLHLHQGAINIKLKPSFNINKERGGEILYLGSIALLRGGTYIFEKKRFVLAKSAIYFAGDVKKPILDLKAKYKSIDYLITIRITGTQNNPIVNFSSNPTLTREEILSVILFDSETKGTTHSGNEMMKMMGGVMAKSALSNIGIHVDHLAFGEGNSIEVGKKLNNRTTVIYINGDVPKIKLKYQNNKRTESVIQMSEESQSVDIIYKKDF